MQELTSDEWRVPPKEAITKEEYEQIKISGVPRTPHFPVIITMIALVKDGVIDIFSVGFLGWLGVAFLGFILWFWIISKTKMVQRRLMKYFVKRLALAAVVGSIPIVNFIPEATILVIMVHYKEKKIVQLILKAMEKISI